MLVVKINASLANYFGFFKLLTYILCHPQKKIDLKS